MFAKVTLTKSCMEIAKIKVKTYEDLNKLYAKKELTADDKKQIEFYKSTLEGANLAEELLSRLLSNTDKPTIGFNNSNDQNNSIGITKITESPVISTFKEHLMSNLPNLDNNYLKLI